MVRLDLLQVLSILTMERPVSFAAEDIRDEKVCCFHCAVVHTPLDAPKRSKFCVPFRPSNAATPSLVNTSLQMESQVTWMIAPCHQTPRAPRLLFALSGLTTPGGRVFLSF